MINVSIIGANGYTGIELLNIFSKHKEVNIKYLVSVSNIGKEINDLYAGYKSFKNIQYSELNIKKIAEESDVVFTALPHGASAEIVGQLINLNCKVIDLSADFRYKNLSTYEEVYKIKHPYPKLDCVYGLCELNRSKIKEANLIANPGCYVTSNLLPLLPLVKENLIETDNIIINSASGTSGAGRKANLALNFCEVNENFKAYSVGIHRHGSEIVEKLQNNSSEKVVLQFTPHLLPIQRGILSTITTKLKENVDIDKITETYNKYYGNEQFIEFAENNMPSINTVKYSNCCNFGYYYDTKTKNLIICSALDNLIKGASGQAVQNMNIMFGFDENEGLEKNPYHI